MEITCQNKECNNTILEHMLTERFIERKRPSGEPFTTEEWILWCPECEETIDATK